GLVAGVALTSLLFAGMHMDPSQLIVIALMGAYLHFVYLASRSIWVPILLHTLNNGIAILVALNAGPAALDVESQGVPAILYLGSFSLVLFASIALWTSRAVVRPVQEPGARGQETGQKEGAMSSLTPEYERVSPVAALFTLASFGVLAYLLAQ